MEKIKHLLLSHVAETTVALLTLVGAFAAPILAQLILTFIDASVNTLECLKLVLALLALPFSAFIYIIAIYSKSRDASARLRNMKSDAASSAPQEAQGSRIIVSAFSESLGTLYIHWAGFGRPKEGRNEIGASSGASYSA